MGGRRTSHSAKEKTFISFKVKRKEANTQVQSILWGLLGFSHLITYLHFSAHIKQRPGGADPEEVHKNSQCWKNSPLNTDRES